MDIYAVAKAAGIGVGVINVWQQRSLIPGIVSRGGGRPRQLDVETATFVGVMAALARMKIGPTPAAGIAAQCTEEFRYRLVMPELHAIPHGAIVNQELWKELQDLMRRVPATLGFDRLADLDGYFERMFRGYPPVSFAIIDVGTIRASMQALESEIERDAPAGLFAERRTG